MNDEPTGLFDNNDDIVPPCLRVPFKMMLSWNDVIGFASKWQVTRGHLDTWLRNSRTRGCEILRESNINLLPVEIRKQTKEKLAADGVTVLRPSRTIVTKYERADRVVFREPVGLIIRLWRPTALAYDISNLLIKPVVDGFVDVRILQDDDVGHLPQVGFDFRGVDRSLMFTADEREARREVQQKRLDKGKSRKPMPMRARIWFDFYRLSRLEGGSIFNLKLK